MENVNKCVTRLRVRTGDEFFFSWTSTIGTSMMNCQQVEEERKFHPNELKVQSMEELARGKPVEFSAVLCLLHGAPIQKCLK